MRDETKAAFEAHAKADAPREACGLVVIVKGREIYFPCRNEAENQSDFIMSAEDYARAEDMGDIVEILHSHPEGKPDPSQADLVSCERSGLPWSIYSVSMGTWRTISPSGYKAPLIGREFSHGVNDCYSLIIDFYREEYGINLLDFERREEWWNKGDDLYMENFRKAGFEITNDAPKRGDVILMQIQSKVVNHAGIYMGDNIMMHHLIKRLSCREVFGGWYLKNTRAIIRYKGLNADNNSLRSVS